MLVSKKTNSQVILHLAYSAQPRFMQSCCGISKLDVSRLTERFSESISDHHGHDCEAELITGAYPHREIIDRTTYPIEMSRISLNVRLELTIATNTRVQ